jgi:hypothetical protein
MKGEAGFLNDLLGILDSEQLSKTTGAIWRMINKCLGALQMLSKQGYARFRVAFEEFTGHD